MGAYGATGSGFVYRVVTDGTRGGTTFTVLHEFSILTATGNEDGAHPDRGLIEAADGVFYGVTPDGGQKNGGVIFRMVTDGTQGGTVIDSFSLASAATQAEVPPFEPESSVVLGHDGALYGTTLRGGKSPGWGTAFRFVPGAPSPPRGQPLNISTRMEVLSGDNVLIAGFIVSGTPGSTKKVMIRGLGPSLAAAGVAHALADPLLELHTPDGGVVTNDDWQSGDIGQIPAGFEPDDVSESVIVADLTIGSSGYSNYTAVLRGAHGETGVGLAEAYDLSSTAGQFANISTRGFVDTGDNVMIGGFIVGGDEPAKVLVRAIGPSLSAQGVSGALQQPVLEVHDSNGSVTSNQRWRSTQESEIIATTIPPNSDGDSAILATLVPGNYTAVVRGKDNTTGVGLVEAYNLK
jgi:hypothetical protein